MYSYASLHQQCHGTTHATSSVTKFMRPGSCNYYMQKKQVAENIIPDAKINIEYNFSCIDYSNLTKQFKEVIEKEAKSTDDTEGNRLNPIYWGPHAWKFFESVAFGYPENPTEQDQSSAFKFFESLRQLLPCEKCKTHYIENFETLPVDTTSRDSLSRWVVEFHNIVNKSLGKPEVSYEYVESLYPKEKCKDCSL